MVVLKKADRGYRLLWYECIAIYSRFALFNVYRLYKNGKKYLFKTCLDKYQYQELDTHSIEYKTGGTIYK